MASRSLADLHPAMKKKANEFLLKCQEKGIEVMIYCTYRSSKEQNELYAQGRTAPGKIVTMAKGGQSKHNNTLNGEPAALAFDCVPLRNGKPVWNNRTEEDLKLWQKLGTIGKSIGLEWAGDWFKFREMPHFQLTI